MAQGVGVTAGAVGVGGGIPHGRIPTGSAVGGLVHAVINQGREEGLVGGIVRRDGQGQHPRQLALGTVGNMVAATPLALLVEALGWRWSFATIGGLTALLAVLFYALVREGPYAPNKEERAPSIGEMARTLLGLREYWIISLSTFLRYGIFVAIQGLWIGPYLMEAVGLSAVEAGNLLLILNVGLIIGSPLSGWISDRVLHSRKKVVMAGLVGMMLSLLVLAMGWASSDTPFLAGVLFIFGLSSGAGIVMYAHIKEVMPGAMTGVALTGVNLFTMLGGGFFLHLMGWVLEHLSGGGPVGPEAYRTSFLIGVAGLVVAFSLYIKTREGGFAPPG